MMNHLTMPALAMALIHASAWAQQPQPGTAPPPRDLEGLAKRSSVIELTYAGVDGCMTYSMLRKKIHLSWRRDFSAHLPDPSLGMNGIHVSSQNIDVAYWPTEVCGFGPNQLCSAGKLADGSTRIEVWQFSSQEPLVDPYDDGTGQLIYPDFSLPITSQVTLYEGNQPGKKLVRCMLRNHGAPGKLFVQFDDSRDLQQLDTQTGQFTTIVSAQVQIQLAAAIDDRWSAHHTLGYLYCFSLPGTETLLLADVDFDGQLDLGETRHLIGDQWYSGPVDFSDEAGYIKMY